MGEPSQEEKIDQLQEVCGLDPQAARHLLEASQWNVEEALHLHFASAQDGQELPSSASDAREGQPLLSGGLAAGLAGDNFLSVTRSDGPADPAERQERGGLLGTISKLWNTGCQAVLGVASEDFQQWFQDRFGSPTPHFCQTTFGDAVQEALAQRKLLMAWFHQEDNAATQKLCKEVLQNEVVLTALQEDFMLWAGDISRFEPFQVARLLGLQQFPSLVLLQPVANDFHANVPCVEWPLGTFCAPLHTCQFAVGDGSTLDSDMVIATIQMTAQDYREEVRNVQEEIQRRDFQLAEDRRLREQQDREYEEALLADQLAAVRRAEDSSPATADASVEASNQSALAAEKEKKEKKAEEEKALAAAKEKEAMEAAEAAEEAERQRRKEELLRQPEPAAAGGTARIRVQLPSGERLQRTFLATQCLSEVYEWAHCCRAVACPKHFELCINFPTRSLTDRSAMLKDLDLVPSAALVLKESDPPGEH